MTTKMKTLLTSALVATQCFFCYGADLKMTVTVDAPETFGQTAAQDRGLPGRSVTIYVQGAVQRVEFSGPMPPIRPLSDVEKSLLGIMRHAPRLAVITHCDTGVVEELNLDTRSYLEFKAPKYPSERDFMRLVDKMRKASEKAIKVSTVAVGETRDFFGHAATHKITTITQASRGDRISSVSAQKRTVITEVTTYSNIQYEEKIDGWYVDLPLPGCAPEYVRKGLATPATFMYDCGDDGQNRCDPRPSSDVRGIRSAVELREWSGFRAYSPVPGPTESSVPLGLREITVDDYTARSFTSHVHTNLLYTGFLPAGLAVSQKTSGTITLTKKSESKSQQEAEKPWSLNVTEYSESPLDPALFTVPAGYKKIK